jgi:hypothetical protein
MDRRTTRLRLTPMSTKSIDVTGVLEMRQDGAGLEYTIAAVTCFFS